jgi:hypothetical protein
MWHFFYARRDASRGPQWRDVPVLVLSYFGITLGWYEHHFGIAQRRAARVAERHMAKAAKQAKKDIERVVRNAERRPQDSSREGTNQNE